MSDDFRPTPMAKMPRFSDLATFMRLKHVADPAGLDMALIGVPFDGGTTNRPGARHGPRQIRDMSTLIRQVNPVSKVAPFSLCKCADLGDAQINPIDLDSSLANITALYDAVYAAGVVPLSAGGDHLVTLPILRAIAVGGPLGMVHVDAHSDTDDVHFGSSKLTHGTPFRRAIEEGLLDPKRVVQIGIRGSMHDSGDLDWALGQGIRVITMVEAEDMMASGGIAAVIAEARRVAGDGATYLSFDVDGLDPVFAPGTGTPEVGGLTTREALALLRGLRGLDFVGGDVVEVAPPYDPSGNTAMVAATMMFEIACLLAEAITTRRGG